MGSYLGEEDPDGVSRLEGDDSAMTGVVYDGTMNEAEMTEEEKRRLSSVPSIKAQHVEGTSITSNPSAAHPPTTAPLGVSQGQLFPQNPERGSASSMSHTPSTSISSVPIAGGSASMYAQTAMTESPKPLSPGLQGQDSANANRQRSPSLTTQFQQQQFGRHQSDRRTSPGSYPHMFNTSIFDTETHPGTGLTAIDAARFAVASGQAPASQPESGSSAQQQILAGPETGHTRTPSGTDQIVGSGDSTSNNIFATDQGIWAYIHSLEEQVRQLGERVHAMEAMERAQEDKIASQEDKIASQEEKIVYLTTEVATLRAQAELRNDMGEKIE
jgi:hypothetical protein